VSRKGRGRVQVDFDDEADGRLVTAQVIIIWRPCDAIVKRCINVKVLHRYRKQGLVHISQKFASNVLPSSLVVVQDARGRCLGWSN